MNISGTHQPWRRGLLVSIGALLLALPAAAQPKEEFPPFEKVSEGYRKVITTPDGRSLYTVYRNDKENQLLAELPGGFGGQKVFIATSVAGGGENTAFQWSDMYVHWKQVGKRLVLMAPNIAVRSGDQESTSSVNRTYTDRVILDVPIITMGPGGGPVIDLDALLLGQSNTFFGSYLMGARTHLATIAKSKAFPQNLEIAFELPRANGQLTTVHYSISVLPENTGYKPRKADQRLGYFTTTYRDMGQTDEEEQWVRYINRWKLEKRDPKLKLSPPKEPIIFYIEHTTPVRYRRWVRDGILAWNDAFEKVGFVNGVEVYYQDAQTGAHMEKDPEDVRFNFIRWTTADLGFAMGPSRVDPRTGQILDADIIMDQSWIAHYVYMYERYVGQLAEQAFHPTTLAWLERNPSWDPRVKLAHPLERESMLQQRVQRLAAHGGAAPYTNPFAQADSQILGDQRFDGLVNRHSQMNGRCELAMMKAMDLALMRTLTPVLRDQLLNLNAEEGDDAKEDKDQISVLDGLPEEFIGPLIAGVITHEVGHTLGLMHNFKASSVYDIDDINSPEWQNKPIVGSCMDYSPLNLNPEDGAYQGAWGLVGIGPYDLWVIEYGYTLEKDLDAILARVAEPELAYGNDIDSFGPDPLCRAFDFGKDPLDFAEQQIVLANTLRDQIFDAVEEGESWYKVRQLYDMTLGIQTRAVTMAAPWIGGVHVHRDRKGDPGDRDPIEVVSVEQQRRALKHMIDNAFYDETYGLTPELINKMGLDKWFDAGGMQLLLEDDAYPVHRRIAGFQAMVLTLLTDPYRLEQVYDNEFRVPADEDALTLPEVMFTVSDAVWSELEKKPSQKCSARNPYISSLRRELQREHLNRLVDLATPGIAWGSAEGPISTLAVYKLRDLKGRLDEIIDGSASLRLDPYSMAHLSEARVRIERTLEAQSIYNVDKLSGGSSGMPFSFFQPTPGVAASE